MNELVPLLVEHLYLTLGLLFAAVVLSLIYSCYYHWHEKCVRLTSTRYRICKVLTEGIDARIEDSCDIQKFLDYFNHEATAKSMEAFDNYDFVSRVRKFVRKNYDDLDDFYDLDEFIGHYLNKYHGHMPGYMTKEELSNFSFTKKWYYSFSMYRSLEQTLCDDFDIFEPLNIDHYLVYSKNWLVCYEDEICCSFGDIMNMFDDITYLSGSSHVVKKRAV